MSDHLIKIDQLLAINSAEAFREKRGALVQLINDWILNDFDQLLQWLYRIDISENRIRHLLKTQPGTDAAEMIADLIIERQLEKIKSRELYNRRDSDISDEERW